MKTEMIRYTLAGKTYEGALVYDETTTKKRPVVLMAPSWMGVDQRALTMAPMLARDRYVIFIADLFGEGIRPTNQAEAGQLAGALRNDRPEMRRRIAAGLDALIREAASRGLSDGKNRAAIGFCFGGGNVMELARSGADIQAAVSFHGEFNTEAPAKAGVLKAAILILHGSADPASPKAQRDMVEAELDAAGARWRMVTFGGAVHSFTEPSANFPPVAKYDEAAARESFAIMDSFLADVFAGRL